MISNLRLDWFLSLTKAKSLDLFLTELVDLTKQWMRVSEVALWWLDPYHNGFRLIPAGQSKMTPAEDNFLPYETAIELGLVAAEGGAEALVLDRGRLADFNFRYSLAAPIHYDTRTAGILIVFPPRHPYRWPDSDHDLFRSIVNLCAELSSTLDKREKMERLITSVHEMNGKTTLYDLYDLVLREARAMLPCDRGVIHGMDMPSGRLTPRKSSPNAPSGFSLAPGEGITASALSDERTYRIPDVTQEKWANKYRCLWPNLPATRSVLAVPILLPKYRVRIETSNHYVNKPLGVLSFESPTIAAFSSLDQECAEVIARHIAPIIERIEFDLKLGKVRLACQSLVTKRDWESIVDGLLTSIQAVLGYEFVSISIIDHDAGVVRCVRVLGMNETDALKFRKLAVYKLDSDHVQVRVVRYRRIEVTSPEDLPIVDIDDQFTSDKLICVFVPIVGSSQGEVIGTICAGYQKRHHEYIYARDVQLLRILVNFGANAMQSWQRGGIDRISHEMNAPLTAVRANIENLRRRWRLLSDDDIDRDLEDMETDTALLFYQVRQLEYVLGGQGIDVGKQRLHLRPVMLFRDIIFGIINQLKPLARDNQLDPRRVTYVEEDIYKIKTINVDKEKVRQVVFNLFMNSIKYAQTPETFRIEVGAEETAESYIIKFRDWGIGVPAGLEEKIFETGFRAPLVGGLKGSGLGLTIARQLMREHGGELILKIREQPTEFHLLFPKTLAKIS